LKKALVEKLSDHAFVVAKLLGQGYDGASNMRGEFNGLQKLIHDENPSAVTPHVSKPHDYVNHMFMRP
jgi:hypothetical protein